jgi:hypothetical protein
MPDEFLFDPRSILIFEIDSPDYYYDCYSIIDDWNHQAIVEEAIA